MVVEGNENMWTTKFEILNKKEKVYIRSLVGYISSTYLGSC